MSALAFLGVAVGLSLLGFLVLWARNRSPRSMDAHIREFARQIEALAPESPGVPPGRAGRTRPRRGRRSG